MSILFEIAKALSSCYPSVSFSTGELFAFKIIQTQYYIISYNNNEIIPVFINIPYHTYGNKHDDDDDDDDFSLLLHPFNDFPYFTQ